MSSPIPGTIIAAWRPEDLAAMQAILASCTGQTVCKLQPEGARRGGRGAVFLAGS